MIDPTKEQMKIMQCHSQRFSGDLIAPVVIRMARRYIKSPVLDVGTGSGALVNRLGKLGYLAFGVDICPQNKRITRDTAQDLRSWEDNEVGTLFCTDVIEHLRRRDLSVAINTFYRKMRKGAFGIFTTINNERLSDKRIVCPQCTHEFHTSGHNQSLSPEDIEGLFGPVFRIVTMKTLNLGLLASLGLPAKLFYALKMQNIFKNELFVKNLFFVVQK